MIVRKKTKLRIKIGDTFRKVVRWSAPPIQYAPITAITNTAPVRLTSTGHPLVEGTRVAVESVKGMTQINTKDSSDYSTWTKVHVVDANTLEFPGVNAIDFNPYQSGGVLKFLTPVDLAGYSARMDIRNRQDAVISRLDSTNGGIEIDNAGKKITLVIPDTVSALLSDKKGTYDLEMVSPTGVVSTIMSGDIEFVKEVTKP